MPFYLAEDQGEIGITGTTERSREAPVVNRLRRTPVQQDSIGFAAITTINVVERSSQHSFDGSVVDGCGIRAPF